MRKVRVAAIQPAVNSLPTHYQYGTSEYTPDVDGILAEFVLPQAEVTFEMLEKAGETGLDIITTCEDLSYASTFIFDVSPNSVFPQLVNKSYPIVEERLASIAKKHNMNIVACYFKPFEGKIYNTASVFDRNGKIIGDYKKTHLPSFEFFGAVEGDSIHTIDVDFGKIGIMICYDMMFPAVSQVLSTLGAEIVFHPTFGYGWNDSIGGATLRTRANDGSFFLVTAKNYVPNGAGNSCVIDPWGTVLVDAGHDANIFIRHEIDLDKPKMHPERIIHTVITGEPNMRIRAASESRPELYGDLCKRIAPKYSLPPSDTHAFVNKMFKDGYHW